MKSLIMGCILFVRSFSSKWRSNPLINYIFRINWKSETDSNRSQLGLQNSIYRRFFASNHRPLKFQDRFNPYYYLFRNRWANRLLRSTIVLIGTTIYLSSVAAVPLVASFSDVELFDSLLLCCLGLFLMEAIFRIYVYLDVLAQGRYLRVSGWFELIATVPNFDKEFTEGIETSLQRTGTRMFYALFGAYSFHWLLHITFIFFTDDNRFSVDITSFGELVSIIYGALYTLFFLLWLCYFTWFEFCHHGTYGVYLGVRSINRISVHSRMMLSFFLPPACFFVGFLEMFYGSILNFRSNDSILWSLFLLSVPTRIFLPLVFPPKVEWQNK